MVSSSIYKGTDRNKEIIKWDYRKKRFRLKQYKLRKKHVKYFNNKMRIKFGVQTIINRVVDSLLYVKNENRGFEDFSTIFLIFLIVSRFILIWF